jgi:hypothetical protein
MIAKYFRIPLLIVLQILPFACSHDLIGKIIEWRGVFVNRDIAWGITLDYAVIVFIAICIIGTLISGFTSIEYPKIHAVICIASTFIFMLYFVRSFHPGINMLQLLTAAFFGFSSVLLIKLLKRDWFD